MFLRALRRRLGIAPKEDTPQEVQLELPFDPPLPPIPSNKRQTNTRSTQENL
jgi:hypothetical protein